MVLISMGNRRHLRHFPRETGVSVFLTQCRLCFRMALSVMMMPMVVVVVVMMMIVIVVMMMVIVIMIMIVVMMVVHCRRSLLWIKVFVGFPRVFETGIALTGA